MNALLLPVTLLLTVVVGACFLSGYLWYGHAARVHATTFFPDDATGVSMLRHGVAAGFFTFGGFLLTGSLSLLDREFGASNPERPLVGLPFEPIAVGLFVLALSLFVVGGVGSAADAFRTRTGVR